MSKRTMTALLSALVVLLAENSASAIYLSAGFEPDEGYSVGKLTPSQPSPIGDIGWGNNVWTDLGGNNADPEGFVVAAADAPQGRQYYQRLGGGNSNLAIREFPPLTSAQGDFSIRWRVRIDTDQTAPNYFANFATIEVDDTGPGGRIMTFRYNNNGAVNLSSVQNGIAKWDGTGDPALASALNQFVKGGLNVYWATKEIEVFMEGTQGESISIGTFSFRETNTDQVDRLFLGVGPGGTALQGVSWDDIVITSELLPEPAILPVKATDPSPADGAFVEDTWVNLSWSTGRFAASHDVYLGETLDEVSNATNESEIFRGNQTTTFYVTGFPGYAYPEGLVPGTTYYWRIDEVNDADPNSPWKGDVWSFSIPPQTAYNPDPADGAEFVGPDNVTLTWTPGFGAKLHTVYFGDNFNEVNDTTVGVPSGSATYNPGSLEREKVYYWRVDESDGIATYKGDIWAFTTPGATGAPQPADGAEEVEHTRILTWTPADNADSHDVYFGTEVDAVENATTTSPQYKGNKARGNESYDPGQLDWETSYYWRVDAVYGVDTVKGLVWCFTTADFLVVDDFESYTDDDAVGQTIWQAWIDGLDVADNGAQVGYLFPPYCEQTIVHSGVQSMPLLYTNEAGVTNSEAVLPLTSLRDWTTAGVAVLSLWFRGDSANAAEPMYVAISNIAGTSAIVVNDDSEAALARGWKEWRVPLQAFADQGINLTDVDKFAIGLGSKSGMAAVGGIGTMYIDDIRLYWPTL